MAKIKYTDEGLLPWQGAICKTPIFPLILNMFGIGTCTIIIKPKYKNDIGLLKHELKHEEQFKNNMFHSLRYKFNRSYRLECELEAYKEQIKEYKYKNIEQKKFPIKISLPTQSLILHVQLRLIFKFIN